ncbi:MAG: iron-containing alcohol dehydrogenase [Eubacteriales bacterium]|nr:iron-containing alcohol dehydrogenase [Eubacteriales bacterium]
MANIHRIRHWIMGRATGMISREPELIKGCGSLLEIPGMLAAAGHSRVLVVTTQGFLRRGSLEPFFLALKDAGVRANIFSEVVPDPTIECVEKAVTAYVMENCQAVVAIGGGSVMDCAKAAAARVVQPDKQIREMKGLLKIHTKLPDLYGVPTTAGTGSEATAASVVTDTVNGRHYKYSLNDTCLIPKYAVLDPMLLLDLPPGITAETGMDALTHAVEAYTNKYPSKLVKNMAMDSVKLIYDNLPKAFKDGKNIEAREKMLLASYEAGVAFTNNYVGYVHAVAHGIGALYGMTHGKANAIILPYVMEQYGKSVEKTLAGLAVVAGIGTGTADGVAHNTDAKLAAAFIESIRMMNASFGIPEKIEELKEEDFELLIDRAISEANFTYPVPEIWGRANFRKLLYKLMK